MIMIMWVVQIIQFFTPLDFGNFGIRPRSFEHLTGIFTAPFVHGDFPHIISNTPTFFVLMATILFFFRKVAYKSILVITVLTGLFVWVFARESYHIGASGVLYGLVSFVFWSGVFRRNVRSIILALIVLMMYSGLIVGVLPTQEGVSWESHLFGGISGIIAAYLFRKEVEEDELEREEYPEEDKDFFFDRDTFSGPEA